MNSRNGRGRKIWKRNEEEGWNYDVNIESGQRTLAVNSRDECDANSRGPPRDPIEIEWVHWCGPMVLSCSLKLLVLEVGNHSTSLSIAKGTKLQAYQPSIFFIRREMITDDEYRTGFGNFSSFSG